MKLQRFSLAVFGVLILLGAGDSLAGCPLHEEESASAPAQAAQPATSELTEE
jgi:hypothetical protein